MHNAAIKWVTDEASLLMESIGMVTEAGIRLPNIKKKKEKQI
jgi:hypothetical protein